MKEVIIIIVGIFASIFVFVQIDKFRANKRSKDFLASHKAYAIVNVQYKKHNPEFIQVVGVGNKKPVLQVDKRQIKVFVEAGEQTINVVITKRNPDNTLPKYIRVNDSITCDVMEDKEYLLSYNYESSQLHFDEL